MDKYITIQTRFDVQVRLDQDYYQNHAEISFGMWIEVVELTAGCRN
jgi:hypothetical protein